MLLAYGYNNKNKSFDPLQGGGVRAFYFQCNCSEQLLSNKERRAGQMAQGHVDGNEDMLLNHERIWIAEHWARWEPDLPSCWIPRSWRFY